VGLALARYRQAEAHHRQGDGDAAGRLLREARDLLRGAAPGDRQAVARALRLLKKGPAQAWPAWRWQDYDDLQRIAVLFKP
jgi:hypothetical protein